MSYNFEMEYDRERTEGKFVITQGGILGIGSYWEDLIACRPQNSARLWCGFSRAVLRAHTWLEDISWLLPEAPKQQPVLLSLTLQWVGA